MKNSLIPGFVRATVTVTIAFFPPPRVPPGYVPVHRPARDAEAALPAGTSSVCLQSMGRDARSCLSRHIEEVITRQGAHMQSTLCPCAAAGSKFAPPQADPPADAELRQAIDSLAFFVARNGEGAQGLASPVFQ